MSDFGDFNSSEDPTADFLARERAVLGGDADIFTTLDNNDFTSGPISTQQTPDLYNDLMSPSSALVSTPPQPSDYSAFENSYPKAENLESSQVQENKDNILAKLTFFFM
jgi:hypothetical protein